jgi:hypothetical protein
MVMVATDVPVGVPEITPVAESIDSPVGKDGAANETVPLKPEAVNVPDGVIATPGVPVIVCVDGLTEVEIFGAVGSFGATDPKVTPFLVTEPIPSSIINTGDNEVSLMLKLAKPSL